MNLGDSYNAAGRVGQGTRTGFKQGTNRASAAGVDQRRPSVDSLKPKDLIGIPWMVAFALRSDGWWLRGDQIWAKPNGMPESVQDRPTRSHEYVFLLTKAERYYYDAAAVRLPAVPESVGRLERAMRANLGSGDFVISGGGYAPPGQHPHSSGPGGPGRGKEKRSDKQRGHSRRHDGFNDRWDAMEKAEQQSNGAALRSVWWLAPANSGDDHFAVMPETMEATCILASTKAGDVVLDPFGGSGTTGKVAIELGRNAILIEANPDYVKLCHQRCATTRGLPI